MYANDVEAVKAFNESVKQLRAEIAKAIVGQQDAVDKVLMAIFCNGHSLLVGVPGLAKTLLVKSISDVLDLSFKRIQFTPDLMPSDITGTEILNEQRQFKFIPGPLFANILLADEINRTPPKTQSALLEAMQERYVTVGGQMHALPSPFFVLATQNPIEQEGTYPLPEAQLDRFMFQLTLDYPSFKEEVEVVKNTTSAHQVQLKKIVSAEQIQYFQQLIRRMPMADNVLEYAVKLSASTRPNSELANDLVKKYIAWGAGPRASQYLVLGAKCHAAMQGKFAPDQEDVRAVAEAVLRHRVVANYKAEAEGVSLQHILTSLY
ncbi:MAG: AAA family ATPase [Chitinophagales bacterium]|jgi:MoxR-like ATPase|nr:AAA family ATPase [Chitinophagales bacterium]